MFNFSRVLVALLCLCCLGVSSAAIQLEITKKYAFVANSYVSPYTFTSASSACAGLAAHISGGADYNATVVSNTETACTVTLKSKRFPNNSPLTDTYEIKSQTTSSCPANSNPSGPGTCQCVTNFTEEAGVCKKKPLNCEEGYVNDGNDNCVIKPCDPGEIRFNGKCIPDPDLCPDGSQKVNGECKKKDKCERDKELGILLSASMPTALCEAGCTYMTSNAIVCADDQGKPVCARSYYSTGGTCNQPPGDSGSGGGTGGTGGDNGGGTGGDNGGGTGGGPGGGTGGSGGGGGDKPDTKPNIPGTDPDPGTGKCGPGTYMSGGKCYPNKTDEKPTDTGNGDGKCPEGYRKEGSKCLANQPPPDEDKDKEFCKQNPEVTVCKKGSFGGSCKGGFTCEGDAIQCSISREMHENNCKLLADSNTDPLIKSGLDGSDEQGADNLKAKAEQISVGSFDQSGYGWGASCPPDIDIPLGFTDRSVVISFAGVCGPLSVLSYAGVAITLLGCLVWVVGGKKS